jgi:hypothetical protein
VDCCIHFDVRRRSVMGVILVPADASLATGRGACDPSASSHNTFAHTSAFNVADARARGYLSPIAMKTNQAAYEVGQLAQDMARGYAAHITAIRIASRLDHKAFFRLIADYPSDFVQRKDGTKWSFDTQDALGDLADKEIAEELPRVWLAGSLLAVGDELKKHDYFGHAPELELVRHLRNGIAHGNRFRIEHLDEKHPAHNRDAWFKHTIFEITPELDGQPVLFDFMEAGDVVDLLFSVSLSLKQMENGKSPRPSKRKKKGAKSRSC